MSDRYVTKIHLSFVLCEKFDVGHPHFVSVIDRCPMDIFKPCIWVRYCFSLLFEREFLFFILSIQGSDEEDLLQLELILSELEKINIK